ncbi:hypothetical protein CONLIGDRAFT_637695 [Coniochaeta ligniaria NRRL 30616]|uniref:HNH nuclease domain-containing protein n=1 Tax=Coniochaeta ligniaria NRRL 30616 TaxID=1408157 RepID=A0A1J7IQ20_9PEZI|nr:hypothetical protein CONLIGDRAFT_637695 [Coniochaeta ligniaria NRRL 30616]
MVETCIKVIDRPKPQILPRFIRTDEPTPDRIAGLLPLRRRGTQSSSRSPSKKRSASGSPTKDDAGGETVSNTDLVPPTVPTQQAQRLISNFRSRLVNAESRCAVTGMRGSWTPSPGLGLEACHVVPQKHYFLYPPMPPLLGRISDPLSTSDMDSLSAAWTATWNRENGIVLFSHLHKMFDARLFAIHPDTKDIRVFMPSDVLLQYHGRRATFNLLNPPDQAALRYHWDCCVAENMLAKVQDMEIVRSVSPLITRLLPAPIGDEEDGQNTRGDPQKGPRNTSPNRGDRNPGLSASGGGSAEGLDAQDDTGVAMTPDSMLSRESLKANMEDDEEWYRGRRKRQKFVTSVLGSDEILDSVE